LVPTSADPKIVAALETNKKFKEKVKAMKETRLERLLVQKAA
jgi:hypothetical protein